MTILVAVSSSGVLRNPSDRCFERFRRGGDPRDLAAVFDRTAPEVWRVAAHLCRHQPDAEDAVQGTFLAAIEHRDDWDKARPLLPWLLGLLVNRVREQRRRAARIVDTARLAPERADDPAENAARSEFGAAFASSLQRLDAPSRSVLEQHLVHGMKAHEIAAQAGVTAGAVRMRIHRGLDQLRRLLPRAGFATGAVALRMPPASLANVRTAVLARIPGGPAIPASASFGVFGALTLSTALLAGASAIALACVVYLWPSNTEAPMPVVASATSAAAPAEQPLANQDPTSTNGVAAAPRPAERIAAGAAPARGTLRIVVRTAWNDAPIANTSLQVAYGVEKRTGSQATSSEAPSAVPQASLPDPARGQTTATTDDAGVARVELPIGRARISAPVFAANPTVVAEVRADVETECRLEIPAELTAVVRVTDGDRPIAGARIVGRVAGERCLVERELGITDDAGRWSDAFADRYVTVRAVARGRAASAPVTLQKENHDVSLRIGGQAAVVSGIVFASDGAPFANAEVLLHAREARGSEIAPIAVRTSANGTFTCDYVPPGPCLVLAARQLENGQRRFTMRDVTAAAGTPATIELRFPTGARLAAKVTRANGDTGGHGNVTLVPMHRELPRSLRFHVMAGAGTNAQGECVLDGLFPGAYELRVSGATNAPSTVELRDGETREVVATLDAIEWLEVEVVDEAGAPLAGWHVAVDDDARRGDGRTLTAKGRARFEGLAPGAHEVTVRRERGGVPVLRRSVPGNQRTSLVVPKEARTLHVVRGTVAPPAGVELRDLEVVIICTRELSLLRPSAQTETTVDATSRAFTFVSVPAGTYHLMIVSRVKPLAMRTLEVRENDLDLGEIELGSGTLELQLTRSDGRPVREPAMGIDLGAGMFALGSTAGANALVRELPAATYRLLAWGRDVEPVVVPATVRVGERTAVPVTLRPATPTSLVFTGVAAQHGQSGIAPATDSLVPATITLHRDGAPLLTVVVDLSQPFVRGLTPGAYRVEFTGGNGTRGTADFRVTAEPGEPVAVQLVR